MNTRKEQEIYRRRVEVIHGRRVEVIHESKDGKRKKIER
jgi:hypothetical protein